MDSFSQGDLIFSGIASVDMTARFIRIHMDGLIFQTNFAGRWRVTRPQGDLTIVGGAWVKNLPRLRPDVFRTLQQAYQAAQRASPPLAEPVSMEKAC